MCLYCSYFASSILWSTSSSDELWATWRVPKTEPLFFFIFSACNEIIIMKSNADVWMLNYYHLCLPILLSNILHTNITVKTKARTHWSEIWESCGTINNTWLCDVWSWLTPVSQHPGHKIKMYLTWTIFQVTGQWFSPKHAFYNPYHLSFHNLLCVQTSLHVVCKIMLKPKGPNTPLHAHNPNVKIH